MDRVIGCEHRREGICHLGRFGGHPSAGVCLHVCQGRPLPSPGLGDLARRLLDRLGISRAVKAITRGRPCGCAKRQKMMNERGRGLARWLDAWREL